MNAIDIKKSLKICSNIETGCEGCSFRGGKGCIDRLNKECFDLIIKYEDIFEKVPKVICENTYPGFDMDGKPVNIWKAETGYKSIENFLKEMVGEDNG